MDNPSNPVESHAAAARRFLIATVVLLVLAGLLRWDAALGDFWLDEVWTWFIAAQLKSAGQILTEVQQENNHYLNTWLVWRIGPDVPWIWYRLPAVLAGIATVALAGAIAARDRVESFVAMLLTGGAYLLVHYSSEARGYASVVLFSALAYWLLDRSFLRRRILHEALFSLACVGGFLSQPMFLIFFGSAFLWAAWRWWRLDPQPRNWLQHMACAFLLPTLFAGWLYVVDLSRTVNAGGTIYRLGDVVIETLSLTVGGPASGPVAVLIAAAVVAAFVAGLVILHRAGDDRRLFDLLVCVVVPAALLLVLRRNEVYVRYFLISVFFLLLLLASLLARLLRRGRWSRIAASVLIAAMLIGNAIHLQRLLRLGRGHYVAALELINAETRGPEITVSSDHDFRNGMLLAFYSARIPDLKPLRYISRNEWPAAGPEWVLLHDQSADYHPPSEFEGPNHRRYRLVRVFPYAGLSGWHWAVYRREE